MSNRLPACTAADIARAYSVSVRTVREWQAQRRIPFLKIGKIVRFDAEAVAKALNRFEVREATR
jgi:excisionase family DNA binding protein